MPEDFDADAMTSYFLGLKRACVNMDKDNEKRKEPAKLEMERVLALMGEFLDSHKMKSAPSKHGVFYKELEVRPRATDWTAFYNWIKQTDAFEFLHKRITADAVAAYMELHRDDEVALPPGI